MKKIKQVTREVLGFVVMVVFCTWLILSTPLVIVTGLVIGNNVMKDIMAGVKDVVIDVKDRIEEEL